MRRVEVFFYGLFMDDDLLRAKGLAPEGGDIATVQGFALRIGERAALIASPEGRVYGRVFSLTPADLQSLYADPGVEAYRPHAVLAQLATGDLIAALCYNLPQPPAPVERNPDYAARLRVVAQKVGLPPEYIASVQ